MVIQQGQVSLVEPMMLYLISDKTMSIGNGSKMYLFLCRCRHRVFVCLRRRGVNQVLRVFVHFRHYPAVTPGRVGALPFIGPSRRSFT